MSFNCGTIMFVGSNYGLLFAFSFGKQVLLLFFVQYVDYRFQFSV
jgi:hypothetical protein